MAFTDDGIEILRKLIAIHKDDPSIIEKRRQVLAAIVKPKAESPTRFDLAANWTNQPAGITDMMSGEYGDPVRVVGFNILERWAEDVSEDIAREIMRRRDSPGKRYRPRFSYSSGVKSSRNDSSPCRWRDLHVTYVRCCSPNGLKSDIAPCPGGANVRHRGC